MGNIDKNKYKYIFIFSIYKSILLFYLFYFFLSSLELLVIIIKCIFALEFYPKVKNMKQTVVILFKPQHTCLLL